MQLPAGDVMVFLIIAYSGQFDAILIMLSFLLAKGILVFILIKRTNLQLCGIANISNFII